MRRNFMWRLCHAARGGPAVGRAKRTVRCGPGQVEYVNRAGTAADLAQPVPDCLAGDLAGGPCGLERAVPERQVGCERGRVRAAGAVGRAVGVTLPGDQVDLLAVEEDVGGLLAVAAGDHDRPQAEAVHGAGELVGAGSARLRPARVAAG